MLPMDGSTPAWAKEVSGPAPKLSNVTVHSYFPQLAKIVAKSASLRALILSARKTMQDARTY